MFGKLISKLQLSKSPEEREGNLYTQDSRVPLAWSPWTSPQALPDFGRDLESWEGLGMRLNYLHGAWFILIR